MAKLVGKNKQKDRRKKEKIKASRKRSHIMKLRSQILTFDDLDVSAKSQNVIKGEDISFISKMKSILWSTETGAGLAASQIGILKRVCVVMPDRENRQIITMINPVIMEMGEEKEIKTEGCLSYPDVYGPVERSKKILVMYYTEDWVCKEVNLRGLFARIVQHETDHFDGVCEVQKFHHPVKLLGFQNSRILF